MFQPREPKDLMKISLHESVKADIGAIPRVCFFIWWEHWAASGVYSGAHKVVSDDNMHA